MTFSRALPFVLLAFLTGAALASPALAESYEEALDRATRLYEEHKDYPAALDAYKQAERLTDRPTFELWSGAANAALAMKKYDLAAEHAERAVATAGDDGQKAMAHTQLGVALVGDGTVSKRKTQAAIESFRVANDLQGSEAKLSRYMLGLSLVRLGEDDEGLPLLRSLVADWPDHELAGAATILIVEPRRARERMLPVFEEETLAGAVISDRSLRGKVVLIDVWATWCAPCRSSVPHLKKLHEKMADEPFTILGVSVDGDEQKLRDYVSDYQMEWPQIWDQTGELATARLQAKGYPTYIVVDHEGVIRFVDSGWSEQLGFAIDREVRAALKAARKAAKSS